jgi:ubiquinone/menaquinone biosynthesis C-methylase UbiE
MVPFDIRGVTDYHAAATLTCPRLGREMPIVSLSRMMADQASCPVGERFPMKETQHEVVRREFRQQAPRFGAPGLTLSNREYLQWMVDQLDLQPHFEVLDVAAGTGHLSRAIAPHVRRVVALDLTPEMLAQGRRDAEQEGLTNLVFEQGEAEALPYPSEAFDLVVNRFALHHFEDLCGPIQEMTRVCRPGGQVAIIDMVSADDPTVAATHNHLERLRDPSHIRAPTAGELQQLVREAGLNIVRSAPREAEVHLERWLELTHATPAARQAILEALTQDLQGRQITGMRPFMRDQEMMFVHAWLMVVAGK